MVDFRNGIDLLLGPTRSWLLALRPVTLTASGVPVLIGSALAAQVISIDWVLFGLALFGAVLIQGGTNLADEYADHRRGTRSKYPAPHKVIQRRLLSEGVILAGMIVAFGLGSVIGIYIVSEVGWPILILGAVSIIVGYLHSSGPFPLGHWFLGELTVFIFMGPLIVMASYFVQTQVVAWEAFTGSLPIGFLVTAILHANNLRDVEEDRTEGKHTIATSIDLPRGRRVYVGLVIGAYLSLIAGSVLQALPVLSLLALLTLPWAVRCLSAIRKAEAGPDFHKVLVTTAHLHLSAGLLMASGIALQVSLG